VLKFRVLNVKQEFKIALSKEKKISKENLVKQSVLLKEDLKNNTPIDTGFARDSWQMTVNKDTVNLTNTAPYIKYLNQGTSQQAPALFIESTALRYGKPIGTIVEELDDNIPRAE
jgi:HK97 gp10 family phage protein